MNTFGSSALHPPYETGSFGIEGRFALYDTGLFPEDFPERIRMLKEATGLTWNGFADALGVDPKQVLRWRHGTEPCGGALFSIFRLASTVQGGLDIIMGEGFLASLGAC